MKYLRTASVWLLLPAMCGCTLQPEPSSASTAEDIVEGFCQSYFTLHYADAATYCTEESQRWLSFAASNIHEEDLAVLRTSSDEVSVRIMELNTPAQDSTGSAMVRVRHYLSTERIDAPARLCDEGLFRIDLVRRGTEWRVRMAGLPQNETRNRD